MRKGLSQVLYLIVAASVLMMIAMVVTFIAVGEISEKNSSKVPESVAVDVAEAHTGYSCSVDAVASQVWLDCCVEGLTMENTSYRACENVRVFQNDSTGGIEVRN